MELEEVLQRVLEITRPFPQAAFDFWDAEDTRRQRALAGLVLARQALMRNMRADLDEIHVQPGEFLGRRRFQDYLHELSGRVADRRAEYRRADDALLEDIRRLSASFRVKYRRFSADMGEAYLTLDRAAHYWKYAEASKIRIRLGPRLVRPAEANTPDRRDEERRRERFRELGLRTPVTRAEERWDVPFEDALVPACMSA